MKLFVILFVSIFVLLSSFCSCSAVWAECETEPPLLTESKNGTEAEFQPSVESLDALVDSSFQIDCHEEAEWRGKLLPSNYENKPILNVYQGKIHENGKRMIHLVLAPVSADEIQRLIALADRFQLNADGRAERVIQELCEKALIQHFQSHVSTPSDILLDSSALSILILYATEEEFEKYAKCSCVAAMFDGEETYRSFIAPNTSN